MSWEDAFKLLPDWSLRSDLHPVRRRAEVKRLVQRLRAELDVLEQRLGVRVILQTDGDPRTLMFIFARARALDILRALDPESPVFSLSAEDQARELEPPWNEEKTEYSVEVGFHLGSDDEPGAMTIGSNNSDNRRVWVVAWELFRALAGALGADQPEVDPAEAMGWNPDAILKPKS